MPYRLNKSDECNFVRILPETESEFNRGEVMTYSSNIDFDHLLSEEDPSFPLMCEETTDPLLHNDSLDLEDVKIPFFNNCSKKDMNIRP